MLSKVTFLRILSIEVPKFILFYYFLIISQSSFTIWYLLNMRHILLIKYLIYFMSLSLIIIIVLIHA